MEKKLFLIKNWEILILIKKYIPSYVDFGQKLGSVNFNQKSKTRFWSKFGINKIGAQTDKFGFWFKIN